jgi:MSHA biogenesis protein MshL
MKQFIIVALSLWMTACASTGGNTPAASIKQEMDKAVQESAASPARADVVNRALLPPLGVATARTDIKPVEGKFDLAVNNTSAAQVFMAIVSGTRYSMLVHPEVAGAISINLKDVTVFDALEAIRELYGYDYKVDGTRIYIQPLTLQTRIYQVNYLTGQREGKSSLRVASGSVADVATGSGGSSASSGENRDSSKVTMTSSADFWDELIKTLAVVVGTEKGRSVVVSPMSGVIVVRAMPDELKNVAAYLKASQLSIERQVILEAKIIEVKLRYLPVRRELGCIQEWRQQRGIRRCDLFGDYPGHLRFHDQRHPERHAGFHPVFAGFHCAADRRHRRHHVRSGFPDQQLRGAAQFPRRPG